MSSRNPVVVAAMLGLCGPAAAQEHPIVKPIAGFVLRPAAQQKVADYDEFRFRRKDSQGRDEFFVKKGKFWDLTLHEPAGLEGLFGVTL